MAAYYNENDPAAAHALRALIADNVIASGNSFYKELDVKLTDHAKQLGYFVSHTKRGVRLRKAGGRFVLFRNENACRAYLNAVERFKSKEGETDGKDQTNEMVAGDTLSSAETAND